MDPSWFKARVLSLSQKNAPVPPEVPSEDFGGREWNIGDPKTQQLWLSAWTVSRRIWPWRNLRIDSKIQFMTRWWWFQIFFDVHPGSLGKWSNLMSIFFKRGWNHQLDEVLALKLGEWLLKYVCFKFHPDPCGKWSNLTNRLVIFLNGVGSTTN